MALVWGAEEGTKGVRWRGRRQNTPVALGVILSLTLAILMILMALAWKQASLWADNEQLWRYAIECRESDLAHNNLGDLLLHEGRIQEAEQEFRQALLLNSDYTEALNSLGVLLFSRGETDSALDLFRRSTRVDPSNALGYFNLGHAYLRLGRLQDSVAELRESLRLDPMRIKARRDLDEALSKARMDSGARQGIPDQ
jgi:tetratricopeptide (TPR) repeat protein